MSDLRTILERLGVPVQPAAVASGSTWRAGSGPEMVVRTPIDGTELARFATATPSDVSLAAQHAKVAFRHWREVPAPVRGELVRRLGSVLRENKSLLAELVTLECGKITQESLGEVQEMIDICDFACGLSRQLYGLTIASERPGHRLAEQWHPLGPVGVITAFNFPVAVWAWNAAIALVCGDPLIWKPSEKTPLCALACHALARKAVESLPEAPEGLLHVLCGGRDVGEALAAHREIPLVSATGSVAMGRHVARVVGERLGRSLLELGGNNGMIVAPSADLEMTARSILFSAVGTAGQRCTTLRRLIVHESIYSQLVKRIITLFGRVTVGDPRQEGVLVGPLIDQSAYLAMQEAIDLARPQGGTYHYGNRVTDGVPAGGYYVRPALVEIPPSAAIVRCETFAPILYAMTYRTFDEAIAIHNGVPQGLASAIFTTDVREAEQFCAASGSDCGIVNVNIGTSGAEIGGAFGGEKETGGGRESGSDAWKTYMRRATNTINYSTELPLAQGVRFDVSP